MPDHARVRAESPTPQPGSQSKPVNPSAIVVFGASGDLTRRKLVPALWRLWRGGHLPDELLVLGFARTEKSDDEFRNEMRDACRESADFDAAAFDRFAGHLGYQVGHYDNDDDYRELDRRLGEFQQQAGGECARVYYLSTPPSTYADVIERTGRLETGCPSRRVVIEKPFGLDLDRARELNELLANHYDESEIFRIDHYLGKETVQNLLLLRFTNAIFEPLWNRNHVACVEITAAETAGVEGRGSFYEQSGALRDMVQMHLLQLLALTAMEQPTSFGADDIRDEKARVLRTLRPITPDLVPRETVRGQYGPGAVGGERVPGYRQAESTADDSPVETYVAIRAWVDNWRWQGVPFYLRTGKRLERKATDIAIHFHCVPTCLFSDRTLCRRIADNVLVLRVQPREGVHLAFNSKVPGAGVNVGGVEMDFNYADVFDAEPAEAYETLLVDVLAGDTALFVRRDQVELAWEFVDPILRHWSEHPPEDFPNYPAGSAGPRDADQLVAANGHAWHNHSKAT